MNKKDEIISMIAKFFYDVGRLFIKNRTLLFVILTLILLFSYTIYFFGSFITFFIHSNDNILVGIIMGIIYFIALAFLFIIESILYLLQFINITNFFGISINLNGGLPLLLSTNLLNLSNLLGSFLSSLMILFGIGIMYYLFNFNIKKNNTENNNNDNKENNLLGNTIKFFKSGISFKLLSKTYIDFFISYYKVFVITIISIAFLFVILKTDNIDVVNLNYVKNNQDYNLQTDYNNFGNDLMERKLLIKKPSELLNNNKLKTFIDKTYSEAGYYLLKENGKKIITSDLNNENNIKNLLNNDNNKINDNDIINYTLLYKLINKNKDKKQLKTELNDILCKKEDNHCVNIINTFINDNNFIKTFEIQTKEALYNQVGKTKDFNLIKTFIIYQLLNFNIDKIDTNSYNNISLSITYISAFFLLLLLLGIDINLFLMLNHLLYKDKNKE